MLLDDSEAGMLASDLVKIADKAAELGDVVVIGSGSDLAHLDVLMCEAALSLSSSIVVCEPYGFDYYDEWRHEEANLPVPSTLLGVFERPQPYPGMAPQHTGKDRVSFWL